MRRWLRSGLGVVCAVGVLGCVVGGSSAWAGPGPGFAPLGGPSITLGARAERPVAVMHGGRAYVALIVVQHGRREMVVARLAADGGHWERLGMPLNHDLGDPASSPRLVSSGDPARGGALYAGWVEHGRLMIARLHEELGYVQWRPYPPGPPLAPDSHARLVALDGRPCALYEDAVRGVSVAALGDDGWQATALAGLFPAGWTFGGVAVYANTLYVAYNFAEQVPAHHSNEDGALIPAHDESRRRLMRLRLNAGRFVPVGSINLPDIDPDGRGVVVVDQQGARPLLVWREGASRLVLAQVNLAGDDVTTLATITARRPDVFAIARVADGIAVLVDERNSWDGSRMTLYRVTGTPGAQTVITDPLPRAYRDPPWASMIAGPGNRPLIVTEAGDRAVALTFTPAS